jgi:PTS system fructose-specific IIC component
LSELLFSKDLIKLHLSATTKTEAIQELCEMLETAGRLSNKEQFIHDVLEREAELSTTLEKGIVLPHAKSQAVKNPSIVIGIHPEGIDCDASDHLKSNIFFLIASPEGANNAHIKSLAEISGKLIDQEFRESLLSAKSAEEVYQLVTEGEKKMKPKSVNKKFFIGVTGCPTGVAHTYLAAKSLQKAAEEQSYAIKVETNGSVGIENSPTEAEIKKADAIIVSCDKQVELERFAGKKVIFTGVKDAINKPEKLIEEAATGRIAIYTGSGKQSESSNSSSNSASGLYKYLMNGVSFMIPFVVLGGIMIALSLAIGGKPTPAGLQIPEGSFWNQILNVGVVGFKLMIPILAGYIAYAIGDRAALAPGMVGGWIANDGSFYGATAGAGFIGAIIAGFAVGYFVKWMKSWKIPEMIRPLMPIMIIPITASLMVACLFIFIIGAPISSLMDALVAMLTNMSSGSLILIGIVIGLMQGFDMGGPFGKVAFMFSVGLIASGQTQFMGAQAVAIPVAPLGMALATFMARKTNLFNEEEKSNGKAALAMGLVGISEGAIPFAASDPLAVIPANMIGSAVACVLGFLFGITDNVAHGGPIVALLGALNKPLLALLAMLIGTFVTAFIAITIKRVYTRKNSVSEPQQSVNKSLSQAS